MDEIVINTKIDTSGIDIGIEEIKSKLNELSQSTIKISSEFQQSMGTAGTDLEGLFDNLGEGMEKFFAGFSEGLVEGLTEAANEAGEAVSKTNDELEEMAKRFDTNVQSIANTTESIEKYLKASKATEKSGSRLGSIFGSIGARLKGLGAKFTAPIKQAGNFVKRFLSIAGVITIFKKLASTIKGSMASLEGWGTQTSRIISDYKKSMEFVQNAMGAMFSPIIDTILPKLITLLDKVAEGFNTIGMYISALLGKKTYTKAVKGVNDYKDAIAKTGQAADKAAGSLAEFDELTIIQAPQEQQENPFVTENIPEEIQQINSLKDLIESIDWAGLGDKAANFVNTLVSKIKEKIENFPIEELVAGITTFVSRFLDGTDFTNIGATLGVFVNKLVSGIKAIFDTDPQILSKMVTAVTDFVKGFLTTVDFNQMGATIVTFVTSLINAIATLIKNFPAAEIAQALSDFISGAVTSFAEWFKTFNLIEFVDSVTDKFVEFVTNIDWPTVIGAAVTIIASLLTAIPELIVTMVDTPIRLMIEGLTSFLRGVGQRMQQSDLPWVQALGENMVDLANNIQEGYTTVSDNIKTKVHEAMVSIRGEIAQVVNDWVEAQAILNGWNQKQQEYYKAWAEFMVNDTRYITEEEARELAKRSGQYKEHTGAILNYTKEQQTATKELEDSSNDVTSVIGTNLALLDRKEKDHANQVELAKERQKIQNWDLGRVINDVGDWASEKLREWWQNSFIWSKKNREATDKVGNAFGKAEKEVSQKTGAMSNSVALGAANIQKTVSTKFSEANKDVTKETAGMSSATEKKFSSMVSTVSSKVGSIASTMGTKLQNASNDAKSKFGTISSNITEKLSTINTNVSNKFKSVVSTVSSKLGDANKDATSKFTTMSSNITTKLGTITSTVSTKFSSVVSTIESKMKTASSDISGKLSTINTTFTDKLQNVITNVSGKMGTIMSTMNGQDWASVGSNMISGMINGINSGWTWLSNTITSIATNAINAAKRVLGISSPSTVFRDEVGKMIDAGLAIGIDSDADVPLKAMDDIASSLADTAINDIQAPMIASGSVLPTQIASSIARADYANGSATSVNDLLAMMRQMRDQQRDLFEALIQVVEEKDISLVANATTGKWVSKALKSYQGVTG